MTRRTSNSLTDDLLRPVLETSTKFYVTTALLALIVAAGFEHGFIRFIMVSV
jgi:hypothetical protein